METVALIYVVVISVLGWALHELWNAPDPQRVRPRTRSHR